jgi:hypothetical protein
MIESHKHIEDEKKKKQQLDHKHYEKTVIESKIKIEIQELKHLVEVGAVNTQLFEKIVEDNHISHQEFNEVLANLDIHKLFEKLEEIENTKDIDEIIPNHLRVKKNEYLQALQNNDTRKIVLQKFDDTLDTICNSMNGGQTMHGNLFSTYTYMLSQKLIPVQENIIDLKQPLLDEYTPCEKQ